MITYWKGEWHRRNQQKCSILILHMEFVIFSCSTSQCGHTTKNKLILLSWREFHSLSFLLF